MLSAIDIVLYLGRSVNKLTQKRRKSQKIEEMILQFFLFFQISAFYYLTFHFLLGMILKLIAKMGA